LADNPVLTTRRSNATGIPELENTVQEIQTWMSQKDKQIDELMDAAEGRRATLNSFQRRLEEYGREHRSMAIVIDHGMSIIKQFEQHPLHPTAILPHLCQSKARSCSK
jgi:hypothetical protein